MFFFGNSRIQFFKISWLNCEQNEKKKLIDISQKFSGQLYQ